MPALGFSGNFMSNDGRFHSAAGATDGHDADDRVVYDTSTGRLFYDADGSGSGAAQLIATLQGAPTLAATDIWVDNGAPGATRTGTAGNDSLVGTGGDDSMSGLAGNDTLQGLDGQDTLDGGDGHDRIEGGRGSDQIFHGAGADTISGGEGVDTIGGFADNSTDLFVFDVAPGDANQDLIANYVVNQDRIVLDSTIFAAAGPQGQFSAGDGRFYASTTATEGHDADDRIIFNQNNGNLYYDADGSGSGAALLFANVKNDLSAVNLQATDIWVGMPAGGQSTTGTAGNDSLTGTSGNDTLNGLAGNDTLRGLAGTDSLIGGDGNDDLDGGGGGDDTLLGGNGNDILRGISTESPRRGEVLDGGLGNDEYHVDSQTGDVLTDAGGVDLVVVHDESWILGAGFENLRVEGTVTNVFWAAVGNELDNTITAANASGAQLVGRAGNDTLVGGSARDFMTGDEGADHFDLWGAQGGNFDQINDFASGVDRIRIDASVFQGMGASGDFIAGDVRFFAGAGATGPHDSTDRLIYDTSSGNLYYDADGWGPTANTILIARFLNAPTLAATDIYVVNGTTGSQHMVGTAGNDTLTGGDGNDTIDGLAGNDSLNGAGGQDFVRGGDGNDTLIGYGDDAFYDEGEPLDTLDGGFGDDVYHVRGDFWLNAADTILPDPGGIDTVHAHNTYWTLGEGLDNLVFHDSRGSFFRGTGNELDNVIDSGGAEGLELRGLGGNDRLIGSFFGGGSMDGGDGNDSLFGGSHGEGMVGGAGNDLLDGGSSGADDVLTGGTGADIFVVRGADGNASHITDFASASDKIRLDGQDLGGFGFRNLGPAGNFAAGDARFWSSSSGTAHDADDRVIYNTSTGDLWYDADGNGTGAARHIFVLDGAPTLTAADFEVVNATAGGQIDGTPGNDSLTGTAGDDTINGLAGNDTLRGLGGNDRLDGGAGVDSMDGGAGDDSYVVTAGDVVVDSGGNDSVLSDGTWTLASGFENLTLLGSGAWQAQGNNSNNGLTGNSGNNYFNGRAGSDTIVGGAGNDTIDMSTGGTGQQGDDSIDGGSGTDTVDYDSYATGGMVANLATGIVDGGGAAGEGHATLISIERLIGGAFNDSISGSAAAEYLDGRGGNDTVAGGAGNDTLLGGTGNDAFVFENVGSANSDLVTGFASGADKVHLENAMMAALGAAGAFVAGDVRYWEAAGATSGHDSNDRVVYNLSNGNLYYDADGSGAGASQLIATLQGAPAFTDTDVFVI